MTIASDAKEIAVHYIEITDGRATKAIMSKTIIQAKSLLKDGYSKEEIIKTIDYIVKVKKIEMYSFGFINASINNMLREINKLEKAKALKEKITSITEIPTRSEVETNNESTERNKQKLNRFGVQSRFGEEFNINMFKRN